MKVVRVRDRWLGILRLLMMLGIFGYIVGYVIIYQKKYMEIEVPIGAVAASLQKNQTRVTFVSELPYCSQFNGSDYFPAREPAHDQSKCAIWDEYQTVYPPDSLNSLFVTTRSTTTLQTETCLNMKRTDGCLNPWINVMTPLPGNHSVNCTNCSTTVGDYIFVADIETFTIMIQHSMQARVFFQETHDSIYAGSSDSLNGTLVDTYGNVVQPFGTGRDIITVGTLLGASNTALDDISDVPDNDGDSMRDAGIVVIVNIDYNNLNTGFVPGAPTYEYQATRIPAAEYKVVEVLQLNDTFRELRNRHGVKIVFIQSGQIGRPTFQATLIQLVTSLGLLSVASLIVEMLMLYVMPKRKKYEEYKFEDTAEFNEIKNNS